MKLTLNNLNKCYGDKVAVKDISFQVNDGETVGILGPNGAGKTTLFYIIAGLIECDSGEICLLYTSPSPRDTIRSRMPSSA